MLTETLTSPRASNGVIGEESCSRIIFGEKTEVAFCRTFRTAAAAAAALRDMLRECNPSGLSLGGVIQEGSSC